MPDEQVEFEIGLRDSISSGLRQIGREIDLVTKRLREGGESGTKSFDAIGKGLEKTRTESDKTKGSMSGLHGFLSGMSRTLMGATGLAAGVIAIGDALTSFAQKRVHMQALAIDLGLSNDQMSIMRRTMARMGVDASTQGQLITNLGQSLKEAFRMGPRSELVQQLIDMDQQNFAGRLLNIVQSGDFNKAMETIIEQYNKILEMVGPRAAAQFAKVVGWPESVLRQWKEASAGVKAGYIAQYAESDEYLKKSLEFSERFDDISKRVKSSLIDMFNTIDEQVQKYDWIFLGGFPVPTNLPKKPTKDLTPKQMGTFGLEDEGALPPNKTLNSYVIQGMAEEDRKTNRLLGEISTTLSTFERTFGGSGGGYSGGSSGGGGSPGGSYSTGRSGVGGSSWQGSPRLGRFASPAHAMTGSGSALSRSQHAPIQTEQPLTGGLSNVRSRFSEELKDPAVRDRLMAYTYAEVGGEGPQAAKAFMETIFNRASARGQTLKQTLGGAYFPAITHRRVGRGVTEGQRELYGPMIDEVMGGSNVSGFATGNASGNVGFGGGPQTSAFGRERFGIEKADMGWARRMRGNLDGDFLFKTNRANSLSELQRIQTSRGVGTSVSSESAPHFQGFLDDLEESGAPISSVGGYNRRRIAGTNRWSQHAFANAIDINQLARNKVTPAFAKWARENPDKLREIEQKHGMVSGGNWRNPDFGHWEFGGARGTLDQSLRQRTAGQNAKGSVKAEVDFSNLPSGAKKSGDELGKFKLLKLNVNPQGAKDLEQVLSPGDLSHTPYVP